MDKHAYEDQMEAHVRELAIERDELIKKLHLMRGRARDRLLEEIKSLEKNEGYLLQQLNKISSSADDSWEDTKEKADRAWDDVKENWRKIKSKITA